MARKRFWSCKCDPPVRHPGTDKKCHFCGSFRPARKRLKHQLVLEEPYEVWVAVFGSLCNICGRPAGPNRNLDRDHDHQTGEPRGLLCHRCNRALGLFRTVELLMAAARYLQRPRQNLPKSPIL